MAADLARDVAAMARAARDDTDGHEGLIRQLEHLQPRIDGILARVNDDGSDQNANDLRRWVVVLVTRIAAAAHAEAPRWQPAKAPPLKKMRALPVALAPQRGE